MSTQDLIPRHGNLFMQWLGRSVLKLFGWRLNVSLPNLPKMVIIVAPHTSNWDAIFLIAAILTLRLRIHWFGKHTVFRWPLRSFLHWLGGIPIDRSAAGGVVGQTTRRFAESAQFIVGLAPEGTRSLAPQWKKGFYQIAHSAQVPIVAAYIDYGSRTVGLGPVIVPSGDYEADLETLQVFYRSITPRHPEKFAANG